MPACPALPAAVCALVAVLCCVPAAAQQKATLKRVTLSSLTAQGFEIKAALHEAVMLQKGADVFWCTLRLADTSPLSYQSECFAVR
jgi:hypothetical protein